MPDNAKIVHDGDTIKLSFSIESARLAAEHRIFFISVLGGSRDQETDGFFFARDKLGASGLEELVRYLRENGFEVEVDAEVGYKLGNREKGTAELAQALKVGLKLKRRSETRTRIRGFVRLLKPFQVGAVEHMAALAHSANFSVPGSGKTTISLAAFCIGREKGIVKRLVVVGPRACFAPWETDFVKCMRHPGLVVRVSGSIRERRIAWEKAGRAQMVLLNYHTALNDQSKLERLLANTKTMLILDESHHIKNIGEGKWANAVQKVAPQATKRVILSGTPAPNGLADLWSQFNFLYPELEVLGEKEVFRRRAEKPDASLMAETKHNLRPLFWRIRKADLGLPRPSVKRLYIEPPRIQKSIYSALAARVMRDYAKTPSDKVQLRLWRRARMVRLLQAASNPALLAKYSEEFKLPPLSATGVNLGTLITEYPNFEVPGKVKTVVKLVADIVAKRRKVIVWTAFVHNLHMLAVLLAKLNPLLLYGGVSSLGENGAVESEREIVVKRFKSGGFEYPVLLANPAACAESISLHTACHDAIYLDRTFNCAQYLQSRDRIHRVGLKPSDKICYHICIAKGTIDEVVDKRLEEKYTKMINLLEHDFGKVSLDLGEDVVSEEENEEIDFAETLKHIERTVIS